MMQEIYRSNKALSKNIRELYQKFLKLGIIGKNYLEKTAFFEQEKTTLPRKTHNI